MPDLPARFTALIISFAPLFVQRSWLHARVLLVGAILAPGRRTVVASTELVEKLQPVRV